MMSQVILYIATSLDGYIARKNGDVSWLFSDQDYGYSNFYQSVGTLIMGRNTYTYIRTFGDYPYHGVKSYILTHHPDQVALPPNGECFTGDVPSLIANIKSQSNKNIWVVGGANVAQECLRNNLIDELRLFVHPIILGDGINLFAPNDKELSLELTQAKRFETGLVELVYKVRKS
jgi:dihydrofolate reductase